MCALMAAPVDLYRSKNVPQAHRVVSVVHGNGDPKDLAGISLDITTHIENNHSFFAASVVVLGSKHPLHKMWPAAVKDCRNVMEGFGVPCTIFWLGVEPEACYGDLLQFVLRCSFSGGGRGVAIPSRGPPPPRALLCAVGSRSHGPFVPSEMFFYSRKVNPV
jgi:hypothetical protein